MVDTSLGDEMKTRYPYLTTAALALGLVSGMATAVVPTVDGAIASTPESSENIIPYIIPPADGNDRGGNRSCADVGQAYFGNALYYECRSDKKNYPFADDPELFGPSTGLPAACANTIAVTSDGTYVEWDSEFPVGAAIIKGGPAANTYVYEPQLEGDQNLASPPVPNDENDENFAGLSNIGGFCWNPDDNNGENECYDHETAWADGPRYTPRGNWATYTEFAGDIGATKSVDLLAGQNIDVGHVTLERVDEDWVKIEVILTGDWEFAVNYELDKEGNVKLDGEGNPIRDQNLKVQHYYPDAPSGNPSPGLFQNNVTRNGKLGEITVRYFEPTTFYGIHVDVATPVTCPTD
jgi:hypothetical protein